MKICNGGDDIMSKEIIAPNLKNFIKSLRDFGYTFSIAIADIIDNSLAAGATEIKIDLFERNNKLQIAILDNGSGMNENTLIEAMRMGSKDPDEARNKADLGRFGLGLKTASFSQCKRLIVATNHSKIQSIREWDLDFIEETNQWYLLSPDKTELAHIPLYKEYENLNNGTLVYWDKIDGIQFENYIDEVVELREHIALVFHEFLEGKRFSKKVKIYINNNLITPMNPFNEENLATQQLIEQKILIDNKLIIVKPYILPHHSKLKKPEYEKFATKDGYTKSQGFYLYREGRLLIHGTWWGLNKITDAHRLIRIKIEVENNQDYLWNIDVKKSTAKPDVRIKNELEKILKRILDRGVRTYTRRGHSINDKTEIPFWEVMSSNENIYFKINSKHPLYMNSVENIDGPQGELIKIYLKGLESYIPLDAIQAYMISEPQKINQKATFTDLDREVLIRKLEDLGLKDDVIEELMKTELYKK